MIGNRKEEEEERWKDLTTSFWVPNSQLSNRALDSAFEIAPNREQEACLFLPFSLLSSKLVRLLRERIEVVSKVWMVHPKFRLAGSMTNQIEVASCDSHSTCARAQV